MPIRLIVDRDRFRVAAGPALMPVAKDYYRRWGDLKAVIEMAHGKAGLLGRINDTRGEGYEFKPVDRDTFQLGMLTLRFRRDTAGKIVGLDFNNPVLRNVNFTRLN